MSDFIYPRIQKLQPGHARSRTRLVHISLPVNSIGFQSFLD